MTLDQSVDLLREALTLTLFLSLPVLGAALVVGLAVSLMQALTQVQEQTLSFVPKIIGMGLVAIVAMPWLIMKVIDFAQRMFSGQV
ncbi:MAG: flagellar biosynthesis protein FliQ [Phycisphaeraceae bacterium]